MVKMILYAGGWSAGKEKIGAKEVKAMMKPKWKCWLSMLLAGGLLWILLSGCSGGSGNGPSGSSGTSDYQAEVVRLVNEIRAEQGLSQLTTNGALSAAAGKRAEEIVSLFSHDRPDGRSCFTVLSEFGVTYQTAGENISAGRPTPEAVVEGWMNSPGHRANILNPNFKSLGVGYVSGQGSYGCYWVQLFIG